MNTILDINKMHKVESYPYGSKRTTAFFWVEFAKDKGFRHVFQTINPKTGKLNKPKKSTYSNICWNELNSENGHIETKGMGANSYEGVNKLCKFVADNFEALNLTKEMIIDLSGEMLAIIRANAIYTSADAKDVLALIEPSCKALIQGFKDGQNVFGQVNIDVEKMNELRKLTHA